MAYFKKPAIKNLQESNIRILLINVLKLNFEPQKNHLGQKTIAKSLFGISVELEKKSIFRAHF
jgi:hypothetical protein